jgi:hypothetical protein
MSVHSWFRAAGRAVATLFLTAAALVLSSCGGGETDSDTRAASSEGLKRALSSPGPGAGLAHMACVGSCKYVNGPVGPEWNCTGVIDDAVRAATSPHPITACVAVVESLANQPFTGPPPTGVEDSCGENCRRKWIVTCGSTEVGGRSVSRAPCRRLAVDLSPTTIHLAPIPRHELPDPAPGESWNQYTSDFHNPGSPRFADPNNTYCSNSSLYQTVVQTCKADGSGESNPPEWTGTLENCYTRRQEVLQWSKIQGQKSSVHPVESDGEKWICAGHAAFAVAGIFGTLVAGGPGGELALISAAGSTALSAPDCINAWTEDKTGFKDWQPVKDRGQSANFRFDARWLPGQAANHSFKANIFYKACSRKQLLRWMWSHDARVFEARLVETDNSHEYVAVWEPFGEPIGNVVSKILFHRNETATATFTEACVEESDQVWWGLPRERVRTLESQGWTNTMGSFSNFRLVSPIKSCAAPPGSPGLGPPAGGSGWPLPPVNWRP